MVHVKRYPKSVIQDKKGFISFIDALPVANSTKHTYRNWVRRLDEHLPKPLSPKSVQSEQDVRRLAGLMPKAVYVSGHIKDVRCIIRYYLKFCISKGIEVEQDRADSEGAFSPATANEGRKKVWRSIALRRGQRQFRDRLLAIYRQRCCVSGTDFDEVLEAAHIQPYSKSGTNSPKNGLLLRSDIHVLFDLFLISIDPSTKTVFCAKQIRHIPEYARFHSKRASLPHEKAEAPDFAILKSHYDETRG